MFYYRRESFKKLTDFARSAFWSPFAGARGRPEPDFIYNHSFGLVFPVLDAQATNCG
jgi:hypothetical protein